MKILPKTIKARVNQLAHRRAQQYALMVRDSTLGKLQAMADAGKTIEDLAATMEAIEAEDGAFDQRRPGSAGQQLQGEGIGRI
jgi:hypothetical protein